MSGRAILNEMRMGLRKQAEVLTIEEVTVVQTAVESNELDDDDHLVLSTALGMTALRSRHHDTKGITSIAQKGDLVWAYTTATKTGDSLKRELHLLLGPAKLFTELPWLEKALERRSALGMSVEAGWPFMPAKN